MRFLSLTLAAVFVLAFFAGCLNDGASRSGSVASNPVANAGLEATGSGANHSGCRGGVAKISLPMQLLKRQVPPAYTPVELGPGLGLIWMELLSCKKFAVSGLDRGPGSLVLISTPIGHPKGFEPATGYISRFVLELRSDNPSLTNQMKEQGAAVQEGTVQASLSPFALDYSNHSGRVTTSQRVEYDYTVLVTPTLEERAVSSRFFVGSEPKDGFFDSVATYKESRGDGEGLMLMAEDSRIARTLGGAQATGILGAWIESSAGHFDYPPQMGA